MYKLQEKELIFYEARPIKGWGLTNWESQKIISTEFLNKPKLAKMFRVSIQHSYV